MASNLHVLISGAGIAGLITGALLERAGISYEIFEKARELRPLGSTMTLSNIVLIIFEQLGIYDEVMAISKPSGGLHIMKQDLTPLGDLLLRPPGLDFKARYGDDGAALARPDLVKILMTLVPSKKIHYNKRILTTKQEQDKVTIKCADNSIYRGSILIGADGAYSSVRQNMYRELEKLGSLPKLDAKPLGYSFDCVVGVSSPMDPEKYPVLKGKYSEFEVLLGDKVPYTWWVMPLTNNRMGWMVTQDIRNQGKDGERNFRFSEWGPDAAADMCDKVRDLPSPYGGTVGDIIDETPTELISKVMLEDKVFTTWHHGRTVLIGDACHKMLPFGGQGANMAIQSAVELVNLLFDMQTDSPEEITEVFHKYQKARYPSGAAAVAGSNQTGFLMHRQGTLSDMARYAFLHWVPNWVIRMASDKYNEYQKQINFLPFIKQRGIFHGKQNQPSRRLSRARSAQAI